jgi:hypothetical protein
MNAFRPALVLALLANAAGQTCASTIFNNFGPGESFNTGTAWGLPPEDPAIAMRFITPPGSDFVLQSIWVSLGHNMGPNEIDIGLAKDNGGVPGWFPGTPLTSFTIELFHFSNAMPPLWNGPPIVANSVLHPLLEAHTHYWVIVYATGGTSAAWHWNSTGSTGQIAGGEDYQLESGPRWSLLPPQNTLGAFRVDADEIPEPRMLVPLLVSTLSFVGYRRLRHRT